MNNDDATAVAKKALDKERDWKQLPCYKSYDFSSVKPDIPSDEDNPRITTDKGYIPLEVQIKRMRLAGEQLMLQRSQFDANDWRKLYESDDPIPSYKEDPLALTEYLQRQQEHQAVIVEERRKAFEADLKELAELRKLRDAGELKTGSESPVTASPSDPLPKNE